MSPLEQLKKDIEFKTPDFYFENLEGIVLSKIKKQEIRARNKKIFISISSIAASFLVLISLFRFTASPEMDTLISDNQSSSVSIAIVDKQDIDNQETEEPILLVTTTYTATSSSPKNVASKPAKKVSSISNVEGTHDGNFNNLDYHIIEYYENEMLLTDVNTYIY